MALQIQLDALKVQHANIVGELEKANNEKTAIRIQNNKLKNNLEAIHIENNKLKNNLEELRKAKSPPPDIKKLNHTITDLQGQIVDLKGQLQKQTDESEKLREEAENNKTFLEPQLNAKVAENGGLLNMNKALSDEIDKLKGELESPTLDLAICMEEKAQTEERMRALASEATTLYSIQREYVVSVGKLEDELTKITAMNATLVKTNKNLEDDVKEVRRQLDFAELKSSKAERDLQNLVAIQKRAAERAERPAAVPELYPPISNPIEEELRKQVSALTKERDEARNRCEALCKEDSAVVAIKAENTALRKELNQVKEDAKNVKTKEFDLLQHEVTVAVDQNRKKDAELLELRHEKEILTTKYELQLEEIRTKSAKEKEECDKAIAKSDDLLKKYDASIMNKKLADCVRVNDELRRQIKNYEPRGEIDKVRLECAKTIEVYEKEKRDLIEKAASKTAKEVLAVASPSRVADEGTAKKLADCNAGLEALKTSYAINVKTYETTINTLQIKINELSKVSGDDTTVKKLADCNAGLEALKTKFAVDVTNYETTINGQQASINVLKKRIEDMMSAPGDCNKQVEALKASYEKMRQDYEKKLRDLGDRMRSDLETINSMKKIIEDMTNADNGAATKLQLAECTKKLENLRQLYHMEKSTRKADKKIIKEAAVAVKETIPITSLQQISMGPSSNINRYHRF
jgi:chromosome segregation ATPase